MNDTFNRATHAWCWVLPCLLTQELTLHLSPRGALLAAMLLEVAVLDAVLYVQYVVLYVQYVHVHSCVYGHWSCAHTYVHA